MKIRGPALTEMEDAFAESWEASLPLIGPTSVIEPLLFQPFVPAPAPAANAGEGRLAGGGHHAWSAGGAAPGSADRGRRPSHAVDHDAYFAGIPPYIQALRAAAMDGVDVRLLVPGASDISILRPLSQAGYRPLLEAGVRVFEWKGSMLHAKDGRR